jgi:hypothetical protein
MVSVYSTPYLDLGDTEIRKVSEKVNLFLAGEGNIGLTLQVQYDWGRVDVPAPSSYPINVTAIVPTYGDSDFTYGDPDVVYGGILTPYTITNIEGSYFSIRLTFTASGTELPHSIYGIILEYIPEGRR